MHNNKDDRQQLTFLDAYICSKCLNLHLQHDPEFIAHKSFAFKGGIGKLARERLFSHRAQAPKPAKKRAPRNKKKKSRKP